MLYYFFSCDKRFSKIIRETLEHFLIMRAKKMVIFIFEDYFLNIKEGPIPRYAKNVIFVFIFSVFDMPRRFPEN